MSFENKDI